MILLGLLFYLVPSYGNAIVNDCEIDDLRIIKTTDSTIKLQWDHDCGDNQLFKVYPFHERWLACPDDRNDSRRQGLPVIETQSKQIQLTDLHPYSEYSIQVALGSDIRIEESIQATTEAAAPNIRLGGLRTTQLKQAIRFFWDEPDDSECERRNGKPDGYIVELWGVDPWVQSPKPVMTQFVADTLPQLYAQGLFPFTQYQLKVFAKNQGKLFNSLMSSSITSRTLPTTPMPPRHIDVTKSSATSVHLRWIPRYPPTGAVSEFVVRVGKQETRDDPLVFIRRLRLQDPKTNYCSKNPVVPAKEPICYVITDLEPGNNYQFEVQTMNANVSQVSGFSPPFGIFLEAGDSTETSQSSSSTEAVSTHEVDSQTLIIVVVMVFLIILFIVIITVLVYKIKLRKLKQRYEQNRTSTATETTTVSTVLSSISPNTSVSTARYIESVTQQIEEIQSRRLPEPPPAAPPVNRKSELYEEPYIAMDKDRYDVPADPCTTVATVNPMLDEDCVDIGGYLQPTFNRPQQTSTPIKESHRDSDYVSSDSSGGVVIPTESYSTFNEAKSTEEISQPASLDSRAKSPTVSNESHPLISLTSLKV